jgi:hypothetical protein
MNIRMGVPGSNVTLLSLSAGSLSIADHRRRK